MLGKLFKHEMKATARAFLPLLGLMFVFTILSKIMNTNGFYSLFGGRNASLLAGILYFVVYVIYGILIGAVFIATILVLVQRFQKNLLGDEGYLMNTLPVSPWQHITAKMLTGGIWGLVNTFAVILSIMVMALPFQRWSGILPDFWRGLVWFAQKLGIPVGVLFLELFVAFFIGVFGCMLPIYACISAGQQYWKKRKTFGAIVVFVATSVITATIYAEVMEALSYRLYASNDSTTFHIVMWVSVLMTAVWYAACFWFTNRHLSKNLNLE